MIKIKKLLITSSQAEFRYTIFRSIMKVIALFFIILLASKVQGGPSALAICQAGCAALACACYTVSNLIL